MNISALENSKACSRCLSKILEACDYKTRNSSKIFMETDVEEKESEEPAMLCQVCERVLEQETFSLKDCVTQVDWLDFVKYLFANVDLKLLENSRICDFCRLFVSSIRDLLKSLHVYDQGKIKRDIDSCNGDVKGTKHLVEDNVAVKQEFDDVKIEAIYNNSNHIGYEDFQCKNEEVQLKMECEENGNDDDQDQSTFGNKEIDVGKVMTSSEDTHMNGSLEKEEISIQETNCLVRVKTNNDFKCTYCTRKFTVRTSLDDHLLKVHNCRDIVTKAIYECTSCSYVTIKKSHMVRHNLKHGIEDKSRIFKCQQCPYETCRKDHFTAHEKMHRNAQDFKCTLCSQGFNTKRSLDYHVLRIHKCNDNVTNKMYVCGICNFTTTREINFLQHNLQHGIKDDSRLIKCQHCSFETYKNDLAKHMKIHNLDFKCSFCSKEFTEKRSLDNHLLKIHKSRDSITNKIHECTICSYATTKKSHLVQHGLKHGIIDNSPNFKCALCPYETFDKSHLNRHVKFHQNIRDYKCTYCTRGFSQRRSLNNHLLKIHPLETN